MKAKGKWTHKYRRTVARKPTLPGVFAIKSGGYLVRKRITNPRTGKQVEIVKALDDHTKEEAYNWLTNEVNRIRAGSAQRRSLRFSEYAAQLYERKINTGELRSAASMERWEHTLRKHLIPDLGDIYIDEIRRADIEQWKSRQSRGKCKPSTINSWLSILKSIINAAVAELELERNPVLGVKPLDTSTHRTYTPEAPNSIPPEKVAEFLAYILKRYPQHYAFIYLGTLTGLRPSSIRPLRRKGREADIKWDTARLIVRRSNSREQSIMNRTKTGHDQIIHLPPEMMEVLRWHTETQLTTRHQRASGLLFPTAEGAIRSRSTLNKPFAAATKALKLGYPISPRSMRRTYQDLMRETKIEGVVVRSISGHRTESMRERYSTVSADEQRRALASVATLATLAPSGKQSGKQGGSGDGSQEVS